MPWIFDKEKRDSCYGLSALCGTCVDAPPTYQNLSSDKDGGIYSNEQATLPGLRFAIVIGDGRRSSTRRRRQQTLVPRPLLGLSLRGLIAPLGIAESETSCFLKRIVPEWAGNWFYRLLFLNAPAAAWADVGGGTGLSLAASGIGPWVRGSLERGSGACRWLSDETI
jgi:hypothetical protein